MALSYAGRRGFVRGFRWSLPMANGARGQLFGRVFLRRDGGDRLYDLGEGFHLGAG